jgi:O-antigen/teichoic acid export membrane protein
MTTTTHRMAAGAAWMVAFKVTERTLTLVSTIVLARLLLPADFGIVAMAMSIVATLEVLTSFSLDIAIIQRADVERAHLDTAWTFNVVFGVLIALMRVVLAHPTAAFYREPNLVPVMYALAVGWFAQGLENIGPVAFRRELDFHKEYWFMSSKKLATFLVTIPLAIWLHNYWALVIGTLTGKILSVWISYLAHPFRPRLSLRGARDLLHFSRWIVVNNILYFVNQRTSDIVIGRLSGAQSLGVYNLSFEISNLPTSELAAPINRAVFPGYSKLHRETGSISDSYLGVIGVIALFSIPAGAGIAAVADPFVNVVLGAKWLAAIPLIKILAFYGCVASLGTNTGIVFMALGRPNVMSLLATAQMVVLVPALIFATYRAGLAGAAWAVLGTSLLMTPVNFAYLGRQLQISARDLLRPLWRPAVGAIGMYWIVSAALDAFPLPGAGGAFARLFGGVALGVMSYSAILFLLWRATGRPVGAETTVLWRARAALGWSR